MLVVPLTSCRIRAPFPSIRRWFRLLMCSWPLTLYVPPALKQTTEPFGLPFTNDWRADVTSVAPVASTLTVRVQVVGGGVVVGGAFTETGTVYVDDAPAGIGGRLIPLRE